MRPTPSRKLCRRDWLKNQGDECPKHEVWPVWNRLFAVDPLHQEEQCDRSAGQEYSEDQCAGDVVKPDHPTMAGLSGSWPLLLGVNEVEVRDGAEVVARLPEDQGGHPLLVLGGFGKGRTAAWTSDIGPHWLSPAFCEWEGYGRLWKNILGWMTATER